MIYKIFIFSLLSAYIVSNKTDYNFTDLVKLQSLTINEFDSAMSEIKFNFSDSQEDAGLIDIKYIYHPKAYDNTSKIFKVERTESKVYVGKRQNMLLLVGISIYTFSRAYFDQLLEECNSNGYYFWGTTNPYFLSTDSEISEFRKETTIAQFATEKLEGRDIYRVSISYSPR